MKLQKVAITISKRKLVSNKRNKCGDATLNKITDSNHTRNGQQSAKRKYDDCTIQFKNLMNIKY